MKHLTALSDSKYLIYGIALIRSLNSTTSIPITIHYYCIDELTYNTLKTLNLENVLIYHPSILLDNSQLLNLKNNNFQYFCWSLASVFTNYIMHAIENDSVTYIDSDIYFHKDIKLLFDSFSDKECGIFRHRFLKEYEESPYGKYNVGIVYFKNSKKGKEVLIWWVDAVLYKKYPTLATCGDQKYLDLFPRLCGSENIYIDENIGHGAPWNWSVYNLDKLSEGYIEWNKQIQPLVFTHFSKFGFNFTNNTFQCTSGIYNIYTNNGSIYKHKELYDLHEGYFEELKKVNNIITKCQ